MSTSPGVLNYDILLMEVLQACPRPDCARFMRTNRFFYMRGFKTLLSDTVELRTEEDLLLFLSYLYKLEGIRFQFVRSLCFPSLFDFREQAAAALTDALPLLSNLDTLSITFAECFLHLTPDYQMP